MPKAHAPQMQAVPQWLILGAFPTDDRRMSGWLFDGPPGESDFRPAAGEEFGGRVWIPYKPDKPFIDFLVAPLSHPQQSWCFAYAATYVFSPCRQKVHWLAGSDDGLVVWIDGRLAHTYDAGRGLTLDQDPVTVTLEPGWHTLLCKVTQHEFNWGLSLRMDAAAPSAARGLVYSLRRPPLKQLAVARACTGRFVARGAPRARVGSDGEFFASVRTVLFNDSLQPALDVRVTLCGADRRAFAQVDLGAWAPLAARELVLDLRDPAFFRAVEDRTGLTWNIASSRGAQSLPFDSAPVAEAFLKTVLGFEVPPQADATLAVPRVFRGQPAEIRLVPVSEAALAREIQWPDLPGRTAGAEETAAGQLTVKLQTPVGMPPLVARITFGQPAQLELATRLRLLVDNPQADRAAAAPHVRAALRAAADGEAGAFFQALGKAAATLAQKAPDRRGQTVTLVGHAHIDMNWLWTSPETVKCCHDTFRQVLAFMDEFPQFTFS